jgi:hypothetical protein
MAQGLLSFFMPPIYILKKFQKAIWRVASFDAERQEGMREKTVNITLHKRTTLWALILMLIFAVGAPGAAMAQGRGRGQQKKAEKFKNGRNARDGRWDGRGPRRDSDDRYDDDDRYNDDGRYDNDDYRNGDYRNRRGGNNGGYYDQAEVRRQAVSIGYQEGLRAGQDDRASGRGYSLENHNTYRDATAGYNNSYGDVNFYRTNFRQGFRQGYDEGYRNSRTSGRYGRVRDILGGVLGRP